MKANDKKIMPSKKEKNFQAIGTSFNKNLWKSIVKQFHGIISILSQFLLFQSLRIEENCEAEILEEIREIR